nr:protein MMS22-like isoform X2 [Caretta caretta]
MDDDFTISLTPPYLTESLEMAMEVEKENSRLPCFSCALDNRDGGRNFSVESHLASGSLKRLLLRLDPSPTDYEEDTVEIFGFHWVTEIALVESCRLLFGLLRQHIHKLENLVQMSSSDFGLAANLHSEAGNIRHQCIAFLNYVKVFIFRYLESHKTENDGLLHPYEELEVQFPSVLVEELHALTLHIGHLYELPSSVLGAFTIQHQAKLFPPSWHLLHLHLDIHWLVLEVLHVLGEKMLRQIVYAHQFMNLTGENLTNISLFEAHCGNLFCDLISLSISKYTKVRPSEALTSHHYPCSCIKELWVLLIHLLDHRNKGFQTESFWSWVNKLLKKVFERPSTAEGMSVFELVQCKDPLSFSWWIITHLASLYQFDRNGNVEEKKQVESNWNFVEELLKRSIDAQAAVLEEQIRMHLQCCLTLCSFWDLNLPTVTILWEYYSKNLNSSFTIPWLGLKGLASVSKTPLSMLKLVKNCCSDQQSPDLYKSSNSYLIFLCILARMMKEAMENNVTHPWKQIKGRSVHERVIQGPQLGNTGPNTQLPLVAKEHHLAVASALWRNFFPFLKSQRISQTLPPPQLADTAAGFTLLALDMPCTAPSDLQPQPVLAMMQSFGWDDMVCPQLVSRYLSHLIQNSALSEAFSGMGHTSYEALSVRSWFRCILQMYIDQPSGTLTRTDAERTVGKVYVEQLTEMTRLVFKLSEVENIFSKAHFDDSIFKQDPKNALVQFIKAVGVTYSGLQTVAEKSAMVTKTLEYLGDVVKYVKPYLQKKGPAEGLQLTYSIIGGLVKSWAPILATSKAQQLLFRIIDSLLLPLAVFQQDKELPAVMLSAIRENLPLYLQGLSFICCQSQTQGAYLNQLLGSVIQQYFGRFLPPSPSSPGIGQHPMLLALCNSITIPQTLHLRKTTAHVIKENYLQFKGNSPPPRLASVLAFILQVFQRTKSTEVCDIALLLPAVLKCMVLVNETQVKKLSSEILQYMVEDCQAGSGGEPATQLTSVFRQFIQDYTTVYDHQIYSILEVVAVLDQHLVISLIPTITQSLKDSEHKQGLGRNIAQREAYKRLLSHLTAAGQNEILKLENETS